MSFSKNLQIAMLPVAAMSVASRAMAQATQQHPNIVYIMCDDHAMRAISAYGSELSKLAPTPNIDRIAQHGMMFTNFFVENSLSAPSRACLVTGLYSNQNGQRQLMEGIDTTKTFFPELLQKEGYQTGLVGKWNLKCTPKGYDYWHILDDQGNYYNPTFADKRNNNYVREEGYATDLITDHAIEFMEHRDKNRPFLIMVHHKAPHRNWMPAPKNMGYYDKVNFPLPATFWDDYATRGIAARSQKMRIADDMELIQDLKVPEMLDTTREAQASYRSLMAEVNRMTPEQRKAFDNYYMPRNRRFIEAHLTGRDLAVWKYQNYVRDYMAVIRSVDESVGRILKYLDDNGLTDNTVIVYTSDQSFYMGEHGWFDKRWMYEPSMHTPFIISWPGHVKEGTVCDKLTQNIDWAPTFLEIGGVKKPDYMPGLSLLPLFSGKPVKKWRTSLYYHYYDYPTFHLVRKHDGVRTNDYKLIHFYGKGGLRATAENKYQNIPGTAEYRVLNYLKNANYFKDAPDIDYYELYDLKADPNEVNNIYGQKGIEKITKSLIKTLNQYRKDLKIDEY